MVTPLTDDGLPGCHRCYDNHRKSGSELPLPPAYAEVPARRPGYVYWLCLRHYRTWFRRRDARARAARLADLNRRTVLRHRRAAPGPRLAAPP